MTQIPLTLLLLLLFLPLLPLLPLLFLLLLFLGTIPAALQEHMFHFVQDEAKLEVI